MPARGTDAPAWRPVWAWLRLDLRRRWLSLLTLALLVAVAAGTVMATAAGARRGASALDRLVGDTRSATLAAVPNEPGFGWDAVRRLPDVEAMSLFLLTGTFALEGHPNANISFVPMDTEAMRTVERPVVLAGRLADPNRADEAVVSPRFLTTNGLKLGDSVTAVLPTPAQTDAQTVNATSASFTGPHQRLTIVGVVRSAWFYLDGPGGPGGIQVSYGFTARYRQNLRGSGEQTIVNAQIRLRSGAAGVPAFQAGLDRVAGHPVDIIDVVQDERDYRATTSFEAGALATFALAAYLAAVVLVGQAVVRFVIGAAADLGVLRTLGLTVRQATAAAAAGPVLATTVGVLVGAAGAAGVSSLFPIGSASWVEPTPGFQLDLVVLPAVAAVTVLLVTVAATTTAFAISVRGTRLARPRRSTAARLAYRSGMPVPVVTGARFALERGQAGAAVRPALVGAVVGVLGVLGALTFEAGVADAAASPARYGQTFQIASLVGFAGQPIVPTRDLVNLAAGDHDVLAVNDTQIDVASIGRRPATLFTLDAVSGHPSPVPMLAGRLPTNAGEIAMAPGAARRSGVSVGDLVAVTGRGPAGGTPMRVTGLAFVPQAPHTTYDEGGWVTAAGYHALFPEGGYKYHLLEVEVRPGTSASAVRDRLSKAAGSDDAFFLLSKEFPVAAQARFRGVADLPRLLGIFLGLLAVGAVGHALIVGVRRRRHELAVLRALGLTRWQARGIVLTQAGVLAFVGLAVGVPVGVALGRALWRAVAMSTPLLYVGPVAELALALIVPAVIATASFLAGVPARRAARLRVADVLRAE
ncbi:FtsX-like permease family protein [Frankia sp. AgB1.9]|nr:FtsX-like permease family protein [Frankia sp. AgW1.1]MBL7548229.1 FtsX-like permease family protein [Frankia sp. AgB1.9]MBL7621689.1 FtsX-like permease family protein [Frankia sp. AgB1.8]